MDAASLLPLIHNSVLLLALALVYDALVLPSRRAQTWRKDVLLGISVGLVSILVVLTPYQFAPGVSFDTRSVLIAISGLFFGAAPTVIAMVMTAAVWLFQGGAGAWTGVLVIFVTGVIGITWRLWRKPALTTLSWGELYLFGVVVHVAMLACMVTLPPPLATMVLRAIALPVLLIYPVVTMLLGRLLVNRQRRGLTVEAQRESAARYRSYLDNAPYGVFIVDETGRYLEANPTACQIIGYTLDETLSMGIVDVLTPESRPIYAQHFRQVASEGRAYGEMTFRRKDGSVGWWSVAAVVLSPTRFMGFVIDITTARHNAAALRQSEQTATALLNAITDAACLIDTQGGILAANVEMARRLGGNEQEILNHTIYTLLPPENVEPRRAEVLQAIASRQPRRFRDLRSGVVIDNSVYPIVDDNGDVVQLAIFGRDVTQQMHAEERYQTLFREMLDGFALHAIICDDAGRPVDYRFLDVNPAFERLTGITATAAIGRTVREVLPATEDYWIETYGRVALTGAPIFLENFSQALDRNYEVTAFSPAPGQFATIFADVTARKRAERALQRRDDLLQALSYAAARFLETDDWEQVMPDVLAHLGQAAQISRTYLFQVELLSTGDWEASQRYEWCAPGVIPQIDNPVLQHASFSSLGFTRWQTALARGELVRGHVHELPALERELMAAQDVQSLVEVPIHIGKQWWGFVGFEQCDREYDWSDAEIEALRAVGHALGAAIESRTSRTRLRQQAGQLAQIMVSVPAGLVLLNARGEVLATNPRAQEYLPVLTGDAQPITQVGELPLAILLTPVYAGQPQSVRSGRRTFELLANPVEADASPAMWVLVLRDVTEELSRQQQLERQERMAAIGQLAAGIAHDFNNLMSIIILNAQLVDQTPAILPYIQERVRIIEQQGQRAAQMIRQILDFSRRTAIERQPLNLAPLLREQVKLLTRTLPEHIQVTYTIAPGEWYVLADPTRIEQLLMNLAVNARDAMPEGGRLEFVLDNIDLLTPAEAPVAGMGIGSWVRLAVCDSGAGIAPEHLPHIFEPFFTTKPQDIGTGLGLAQVHGIVGQHDGQITVASQLGRGTVFTIYLPALTMVTPNLAPLAAPAPVLNGHGELILVAEDEPALRNTLVDLLRRWGYRVYAVANGCDAITFIDAHQEEINLILSDVVMPEMSGLTLFKTLHQRQLDIPIILMTGHLQGDDLENLRQFGLRGWLAKPPSIDQLARTIAEVLAVAPTSAG